MRRNGVARLARERVESHRYALHLKYMQNKDDESAVTRAAERMQACFTSDSSRVHRVMSEKSARRDGIMRMLEARKRDNFGRVADVDKNPALLSDCLHQVARIFEASLNPPMPLGHYKNHFQMHRDVLAARSVMLEAAPSALVDELAVSNHSNVGTVTCEPASLHFAFHFSGEQQSVMRTVTLRNNQPNSFPMCVRVATQLQPQVEVRLVHPDRDAYDFDDALVSSEQRDGLVFYLATGKQVKLEVLLKGSWNDHRSMEDCPYAARFELRAVTELEMVKQVNGSRFWQSHPLRMTQELIVPFAWTDTDGVDFHIGE
jgi:hypothetical protein